MRDHNPRDTYVSNLLEQLRVGKLSRRNFIRLAALAGMSATAASSLAATPAKARGGLSYPVCGG